MCVVFCSLKFSYFCCLPIRLTTFYLARNRNFEKSHLTIIDYYFCAAGAPGWLAINLSGKNPWNYLNDRNVGTDLGRIPSSVIRLGLFYNCLVDGITSLSIYINDDDDDDPIMLRKSLDLTFIVHKCWISRDQRVNNILNLLCQESK